MKTILTSAACALTLLLAGSASGASLSFTAFGSNVHAVYLAGQSQNDAFDTIAFQAKPFGASLLTNNSIGFSGGAPRPAGQEFTYRNRLLDADPLDDPNGKAYTVFSPINTPNEHSFFVGRIDGGTITTATEPGGQLFLANLRLSTSAPLLQTAVQLYRRGQLVQSLDTSPYIGPEPQTPLAPRPLPPPLPEPASASLAGVALTILTATRQRRPKRIA